MENSLKVIQLAYENALNLNNKDKLQYLFKQRFKSGFAAFDLRDFGL